jgi:nitroreductase
VGWNQAQFADCSAIILVCGDRQAYARDTDRYWASAPEETRKALVGMIRGFYDANVEARRDENLRSGGMAAMTIMLAAKAMGYESCPMSGFDFGKAAELVNLPADHDIIMAVTVGKGLEAARERGGQLPLEEVCFRNRF